MKSSGMWHEARKQEKMIRGMIVDYRRRAERRKDFYEKIKAEPTQFLQLHGRQCKIHLDPAVAAAGEGPAIMMPWQGDQDTMIDRFDVRAHLDMIPEVSAPEVPPEQLEPEERHCNYERYRILAQNVYLGISEQKFLQQLAIEEQFGVTLEEKEHQKEKLNERKGGAAIGYNYDNPEIPPPPTPSSSAGPPEPKRVDKDSDDDSDLDIIDVDLSIDVNKMEASQAHELNLVGPAYGMAGVDLFSFLTGDADDAEHQKQLLREEKEKAMFSGRKSRRERRAHRDKKLLTRVPSPPSYAQPQTTALANRERERDRSMSRSRSHSPPPDGEAIQFITSFGGDDDEKPPLPPLPKPSYSEKVKQNLKKLELYSEVAKKTIARSPSVERPIGPRRFTSISRSRSRCRSRSRSRSRSKSRSKSRSRSRSSSRSSHRSRFKSRSRSRSCSSWSGRSRSRSRSPSHSNYRKRSRSPTARCKGVGRAGAPAPVSRYYGRRKEDKSSSGLSDSDDDSHHDTKLSSGSKPNMVSTSQSRARGSSNKVGGGGSAGGAGGSRGGGGKARETVSLKEKLRRKMQAQLSRQLRADKKAEAERLERESRRQATRDEEMRERAIKLRRRQREMRHQHDRNSSDEGSRSRSRSRSSRDSLPPGVSRDSRSRSRSASPKPKPKPKRPIVVWERDLPTNNPPLPKIPDYPPPPLPPTPHEERKHTYEERKPTPYEERKRTYDDSRQSSYEQSKRPYNYDANNPPLPNYRPKHDEYSNSSNTSYPTNYQQSYGSTDYHQSYDNSQYKRYDSQAGGDYSRGSYDKAAGYTRDGYPNRGTGRWNQEYHHEPNGSQPPFNPSQPPPPAQAQPRYDSDNRDHYNQGPWSGSRGRGPVRGRGRGEGGSERGHPPLPPRDRPQGDHNKVKLVDY